MAGFVVGFIENMANSVCQQSLNWSYTKLGKTQSKMVYNFYALVWQEKNITWNDEPWNFIKNDEEAPNVVFP